MTTAVVIGSGIAGPVAAMALHQAGVEVSVHEARPADAPHEGTWLTIASNGMAALAAVGAHRLVAGTGFATPANRLFSSHGSPLRLFAIGAATEDGTISHTVERSAVAAVLAEEAARRGIVVRRGRRLVATSVGADGRAVARFDDGSSVSADLLVGCDGLRSVVRSDLDPSAPPPRYVGMVNHGGYVPASEVCGLDVGEPGIWNMRYGRRAFFGHVPDPKGGVVWFANVPGPPVTRAQRAATTEGEWREHLATTFADEPGPASALVRRGVLEVAGDNVFDHPSTPRWHDGRRVVIGDAAHAPSSISGQGAGLAIEDAVVLAKCVRDLPDVPRALAAYEELRRGRVERMVDQVSRGLSNKVPGRLAYASMPAWDRVLARSVAARDLDARVRDLALRAVYRWFITQGTLQWTYDHVIRWTDPVSTSAVTARAA